MTNLLRVINVGYWALTESSPVESDSTKMLKIGPLDFCGINPFVVYHIEIYTFLLPSTTKNVLLFLSIYTTCFDRTNHL